MLSSADAEFAPQLVQALELAPLANEPEGHTAHAALPVASLYIPAPHPVQGPPSTPVYPKEQIHAVTATLPVTDTLEPDGHVEQ
jgi:L-2-hydroxyglutarate oxidase LhgO